MRLSALQVTLASLSVVDVRTGSGRAATGASPRRPTSSDGR